MNKTIRRMFYILLVTALAVSFTATPHFGMLPLSYAADDEYTAADIDVGDHIYMGKMNAKGYTGLPYWRVIDKDEHGKLMLMSEYLWKGNGKDPDAAIQFNPGQGQIEWQGSNAQSWCDSFRRAVLDSVEGLTVVPTTKSDTAFNSPDFIDEATGSPEVSFYARDEILKDDLVFFLSAEEAVRYMPAVSDRIAYLYEGKGEGDSASWWLRSPRDYYQSTCVGRVFDVGELFKCEVYEKCTMRPAFWAELSGNVVLDRSESNGAVTWCVGGHKLGAPSYEWTSDNSSCTATVMCENCGTVISETAASASTTVEATTSASGMIKYTVVFQNPLFSVEPKTIVIPKKAPPAAAPAEKADLPAVKISKPKTGKKSMTVKWKKVSKKNLKKIQGIEIRYIGAGTNKTVTAGKKKTSKKIKHLISKQTYTVQVRAYANINGVKHVSNWSKAKKVKIK